MARRVVWSPRAAKDLDSIADYIAADSATYASTVLKNIVNQTRLLASFPQAGRVVPEFKYWWRLAGGARSDESLLEREA